MYFYTVKLKIIFYYFYLIFNVDDSIHSRELGASILILLKIIISTTIGIIRYSMYTKCHSTKLVQNTKYEISQMSFVKNLDTI